MASEPAEHVVAKANKTNLNGLELNWRRRVIYIPEPHVTVFTDCLFVVREGQHLLTQAAALRERLLVDLLLDVANQDLRGITHTHTHS